MITQNQIDEFRKTDAVRKALKEHSEVHTSIQVAWLALDWVVIAGAIAFSLYFNNWLSYLLSVVVIAARQHAFLVIMHDASHYRLSKNTFFNDIVSDCFAAYPLLLATATYRKNHLAHHKYTNTAQDPDWVRKIDSPEWHFPQSKTSIFKVLSKQLLFASKDWLQLSYSVTKTDGWKKPVYWAAVLAAVTVFGVWKEFLLYWMVPMLTLFPVLQRIRSTSEHFGLPRTHEMDSSRNIAGTALEEFFFSPHNVNYHLLHHMFPSVPQDKLKAFDRALMKSDFYRQHAHRNNGFFIGSQSVLNDLSTEPQEKINTEAA